MEKRVVVSAPINIALVKYWGKKNELDIIPMNNSISLTLDQKNIRSTTFLRVSTDLVENSINLNNKEGVINSRMKSMFKYAIDKSNVKSSLKDKIKFEIKSVNNFPTAAGLASSASGMAALAFALGSVLDLTEKDISIMARLGSGSATRSVFGGIVEWRQENDESLSVQLYPPEYWPELRVLICIVNSARKQVASTNGMQNSIRSSQLLAHRYAHSVKENTERLVQALREKNFSELALVTMRESNQLHAVCLDTVPPIVYLNAASFLIMDFVYAFNSALGSIRLAYTFDAGPNAFLIYEEHDEPLVRFCLNYSFGIPCDESTNDIDVSDPILQIMPDILPRQWHLIERIISTSIGSGPQLCQSL